MSTLITRISTPLVLLTLALIPLGTRKLLGSVVMGFHEYEAIFLYATDFLVVLVAALLVRSLHFRGFKKEGLYPLFLLALCGSVFIAPSLPLALYGLLRIMLLGLFARGIASLVSSKNMLALCAIALVVSASLQAGIGFAQFARQGSVGLARFGEPTLVAFRGPSSTIRAEGGRFLRAYGTFPHPNVLAGFLSLGLLATAYLYLFCEERTREQFGRQWRKRNWTRSQVLQAARQYFSSRYFFYRMALAASFFLVSLGLATTFSRSGWVMAAVGLGALLLLSLRHSFGATLRLFLLVAACSASVYLLLAPVIAPRAELRRTEPAVAERLAYGQIGLSVIKENPFGVGAGNQVLYGVRSGLYKGLGMTNLWQWEPVHNLYLLVSSEAGWIGGIAFAGFMLLLLLRLLWTKTPGANFVFALLLGIVVVGLFDHYLWTLQPGRLMLWAVVGLALSQVVASRQVSSNK